MNENSPYKVEGHFVKAHRVSGEAELRADDEAAEYDHWSQNLVRWV